MALLSPPLLFSPQTRHKISTTNPPTPKPPRLHPTFYPPTNSTPPTFPSPHATRHRLQFQNDSPRPNIGRGGNRDPTTRNNAPQGEASANGGIMEGSSEIAPAKLVAAETRYIHHYPDKASEERPRLRRLYSDLFNAVTRLDYAVRDEDMIKVWECYKGIVLYLDDILSIM